MDVILLGAPGAGKGTQGELLAKWLSVQRLSTGDLFREAIEAGTDLGMRAKTYIKRGDLVPDAITVGMVAYRLLQPDCTEGVILDGFPRNVAQAEALDAMLARLGRQIDIVVCVRVSSRALERRLAGRWTCMNCGAVYHEEFHREKARGVCDLCGAKLYQREDDTAAVVRQRIRVYSAQTEPLIEYYREKQVLMDLDGEQDVMAVQRDLRRIIQGVWKRRAD